MASTKKTKAKKVEKEEVVETSVNTELLSVIEIYKAKNPVKYALKKEALEAQLKANK